MPNWCENELKIDGDLADLKQFKVENFDEEGLKFAKSCPVPEELGDWDYDWCNENWGTKWEPDFHDFDYEDNLDDDCNEWYFATAWAPPIKWFESVVAKYPSISFTLRYSECGMDFSGIMEFDNGECVCNEQGEYGDYHGMKYCEECGLIIPWYRKNDDWDNVLCICFDCRNNAFHTIRMAVRYNKFKKLPKKLALMRMGRNRIMDQYIMRKVFIKRLSLTE